MSGDGLVLEYFDYSEDEQLDFVKEYGLNIEHIKNPSEAVQLAAVQKCGLAVKFCKDPSEAVQVAAVQQFKYAFVYCNNNKAVQLAMVKQDSSFCRYCNNPSNEMIDYLIAIKYKELFRYMATPYYSKVISMFLDKFNHIDIIPIVY
jgi:hypothetical protein